MQSLQLFLMILLLVVTPPLVSCQYRLHEHNYSRPWLNFEGELLYENITLFWDIMDEVAADDSLPPSLEHRLKPACDSFEQMDCADVGECYINPLPPDPWNMYIFWPLLNRAHYHCTCNQDMSMVDQIISYPNPDRIPSRVVAATCPPTPVCELCDKEHTIKCVELADGRATCVCDPDYREDKYCARKKDGCVEPHPAATLTGKQACMDDGRTNNTCYPIAQSMRYYCVCRHPYREDKRLSFPNCMDNRTVCHKPLCVGFQPPRVTNIPGPSIVMDQSFEVSSTSDPSCNHTFCDCPDGWTGLHCSEKRGEPILGSWSPWSACAPDCIMPSERARHTRMSELHAGNSRATAIGFRSRFSRCTLSDFDYCVGTYRFWRRCRVTTLCSAWTNERLSSVVNEAIGQAMIEHDKAHRVDRVGPISTTAAELTWAERHSLNFIAIAGSLILSTIAIWVMELHHVLMHWNKEDMDGES